MGRSTIGSIKIENEIVFSKLFKFITTIFITTILSLPHSSATIERIFSNLNLIKTKLRNRLHIQLCSACQRNFKQYRVLYMGTFTRIIKRHTFINNNKNDYDIRI